MTTIRRKVKLRPHQQWTDKIQTYLDPKPYNEWMVAVYEEGTWETEELYEANMGHMYPSERDSARYVYEHEVMTEAEYNEWTTSSG